MRIDRRVVYFLWARLGGKRDAKICLFVLACAVVSCTLLYLYGREHQYIVGPLLLPAVIGVVVFPFGLHVIYHPIRLIINLATNPIVSGNEDTGYLFSDAWLSIAVRGQDAWNIGRDLILGHGRAEIGIRAHSYHPLCIAVAQRDGGLVALLRTLPPVPSPTYNPVNLALVQNDMPLAWQLVGDGWDIQDPDVFLHLPQWSAIGMPEDRFLVFLRPRWTDWKRRYAAIHAELLLSFHPFLADYIPVRTLAGIVISYL